MSGGAEARWVQGPEAQRQNETNGGGQALAIAAEGRGLTDGARARAAEVDRGILQGLPGTLLLRGACDTVRA